MHLFPEINIKTPAGLSIIVPVNKLFAKFFIKALKIIFYFKRK